MSAKKSAPRPAPKKKTSVKPKVSIEKKKIEKLILKLSEIEDKHLRLKAEFDNYRRRKDREFLQLLEYEGETIFKGILPIIDDLDRMVNVLHDHKKNTGESIKKGIVMIQSKLEKFLSDWEIESFGHEGETLDPQIHDALMGKTEKNRHDDEILEIFEKGYRYKDRVIRHAKVIVNKT